MNKKYADATTEQHEKIKNLFQDNLDTLRITATDIGYNVVLTSWRGYVRFKEPLTSLSGWLELATILGCKNGDRQHALESEGCPTCGYGAEYEEDWLFWE
jgi:hypothetical protein